MSAYFKTVIRSLKNNIGRFVSISVIILLGIAFVAGLGTLPPQIRASFNARLKETNAADLVLKSTLDTGFSLTELSAINEHDSVSAAGVFTAIDGADVNGLYARVYIMDLTGMKVNAPYLTAGRLPEGADEVLIDRAALSKEGVRIGDTVDITIQAGAFPLSLSSVTVVGEAANPLLFAKDGEPDVIEQKTLESIVYFDSACFPYPLPVTDVYVKLNGTERDSIFSKAYQRTVTAAVEAIRADIPGEHIVYLTQEENRSTALLDSYCDKVSILSLIFPVFFIAVAALVVLTTMTRLIEEERQMLGCYQTLGAHNGKIVFKYFFFSLVCCLAASAAGMLVGVLVLPAAIYPAFTALFSLPARSNAVSLLAGFIAFGGMLITTLSVTVHVARKSLQGEPADTLRPKAPKAGKKVLLERIPFIWKPLSFKYKSTFRNIFRQARHLFMTVISVAGSTALTFAGFALLNVAKTPIKGVSGNFSELFSPIAVVIIIFALTLCAFVVYNLTNMNISERRREIATLKVLGYYELETAGYIYREVLIMAILGVLVGIPLGVGLVSFVFTFLDFGALVDVKWYSYLLAGAVVLGFVLLVDLLLVRKIRNVNMIDSLKSIE